MDTIGEQKLWAYVDGRPLPVTCTEIRKSPGIEVVSYLDLATKVAELQFLNRDFVFLFRGQAADFKNMQHNTSLKPSLFRGQGRQPAKPDVLETRFRILRRAEERLVSAYEAKGFPGLERLKRQRILRWSILQHYEICRTPLLDVTHSLRIAASFASTDSEGEAFIFALGVPNLSGAITASAEAGLQIVRLATVCPPSAVRPHIQEGYLLGEYPEMGDFDQKRHYPHHEIDFGLRLAAKFRFRPGDFWKRDKAFSRVPDEALYPLRDKDPLARLAVSVKSGLR
jgi:hypothetical protein